MKLNTHKIADVMACMTDMLINETVSLKQEFVDRLKDEKKYVTDKN